MSTESKGFDFSNKQTLEDIDYKGKRVLMRVDYNVPFAKDGVTITDASRVEATLPSINYIVSQKGVRCLVLLSHLGRPLLGEKVLTLQPVAQLLQKLLPNNPVTFLPDCVGPEIEKAVNEANPEGASPVPVLLLENVRFHPEEEGKGIKMVDGKETSVKCSQEDIEKFRQNLTKLGDVFVFEAFGASHRAHSSVVGVKLEQRVAGRLMEKELTFYSKVLNNPQRPVLAILGGGKVSDKILVIENLLNLCDEMVIAGGMAYTFKSKQGVAIGASKFDKEGANHVDAIIAKAGDKVKLHFPTDHIIADRYAPDAKTGITDDAHGIPDKWMALDIGPRSCNTVLDAISRAKTIVWNGPLGVFEMGPFAFGTTTALYGMVEATKKGAITVVGGGDSGAAAQTINVHGQPAGDQLTHVSTGGGASLELMEGKVLPGVAALSDKKKK